MYFIAVVKVLGFALDNKFNISLLVLGVFLNYWYLMK